MAGDKINEAYNGELSKAMQISSSNRINYIVNKSKGNKILDIGCSQGITTLLLGAKNKTVIGIDNDAENIQYAQNELEKNYLEYKKNITFIAADFLEFNFEDKKFDTIILGEVLEHLFDPMLFLKKASSLLSETGILICSVPFGINRHPDHKTTYYFTGLYEQIDEFFTIKEYQFISLKTVIIAEQKNGDSLEINKNIVKEIENQFYKIDENLTNYKEKTLKTILNFKKNENNNVELIKNLKREIENQNKIIDTLKKDNIIKDEKIKGLQFYVENTKKNNRNIYYKMKSNLFNFLMKFKIFSNSYSNYIRKKNRKKNLKNYIVKEKNEKLVNKTDLNFLNEIQKKIDKISVSNGSKFYKKFDINIGIIADEFLYNSYKDTANFVFLTPSNWEENINKTDILILVSTWKGLDEEWRGFSSLNSDIRDKVFKIIETYKKQGKQTVFYSKEDPPNYHIFIDLAKKCDYIFTSCEEVVENYKKDCNNEKVNSISFGINPIYHNPIGIRSNSKEEGVIFSGSWMTKYPDRMNTMKSIFDEVINSGNKLKIVDRNYYRSGTSFIFPEKYHEYISPAIAHETLQKVHKLFNYAININTVTDSKTMFANRCYELSALGNILISNYSIGVEEKLPYIHNLKDFKLIKDILNNKSEDEVYSYQINSIRSVMSNETTFERLYDILRIINFDVDKTERKILVVTDDEINISQIDFDNQTYKNKTLITMNELNESIYNEYDCITFFDKNMSYNEYYLEDMINAFKYTSSDYVTKDSYYENEILVQGVEHDFVSFMKSKYRTLFWIESYELNYLLRLNDNTELANGYSIDRFNYVDYKVV